MPDQSFPFPRHLSHALFERANKVIPGGVNSPVRAFRQVGGEPFFVERGEGPYIFDADGNRYIDYVLSWGPLIFGHDSALIREAVLKGLARGTSFGAPTDLEVEFAELLCETLPGIDLIRFVNSGTEATMSAIRLARAFTGRELVLKCNGCYHGHADSLLVKAGSGVATLGIAGSKGVPEEIAKRSLSVEFNDLDLLADTLREHGPENFAALIIEPVPGNMGLVVPEPGYLQGVRELCARHGIVLIFDEVMSGFRVAYGGAQEKFGITADLVTYGKVIGGGLPVGAFGGRADIMRLLAPLGPVYQAGTLSGNPLAMSAGLAAIKFLRETNPYPAFEKRAEQWREGLLAAGEKARIPLQVESCGTMLGLFFSSTPVKNYSQALATDKDRFVEFFWGMLEKGVYLAPSAFEAGFLSTAHDESIIRDTVTAAEIILKSLEHERVS